MYRQNGQGSQLDNQVPEPIGSTATAKDDRQCQQRTSVKCRIAQPEVGR